MLDLIIRNGRIVDGTGRPGFTTDIGISSAKIAAVNNLKDAEAKVVIDAFGLTVSPGFFDMHSHSDLSIMTHPKAESSISQGITTEVVGSCGWSMAPCKEETRKSVLQRLLSGLISKEAYENLDWNWHSFDEYYQSLEKRGIGVNLLPQVGQSLIRAHVVGTEKRPATPGEIQAMKSLLESCMEEGAFGMSTGRSYRPGGFAPKEEIISLAKVLSRYGGVYATHMKSEGDDLFQALEEAISISEEAHVRVEVSHHKAVGKKNFGKVTKSLEMIEEARSKGLPVAVDFYPYEFAQVSSLIRMFPIEIWDYIAKDISEERARPLTGPAVFPSQEEIMEKLHDQRIIQKILDFPGLAKTIEVMSNYLVVEAPSCPQLEGKILGDYIRETDEKDPARFIMDLIQKDGFSVHAAWPISMDDVERVARADFSTVGTDAFTLDKPIDPTPIHPRHFGSFPRVIGPFVRDKQLFSLEEAIRKCTYLPAQLMGVKDRGAIRIGYWADLTVFDASAIKDSATGKEPYKRPEGIKYVIINGKIALEEGQVKPVFSGRVLRRA